MRQVGDISNGGISSEGEESTDRDPKNDACDNENDSRIDVRGAFFTHLSTTVIAVAVIEVAIIGQ